MRISELSPCCPLVLLILLVENEDMHGPKFVFTTFFVFGPVI